jgi:hypothetical protein
MRSLDERFERFRNEVIAWAMERGWPILRDGEGFLVSRQGQESWVALVRHVGVLSARSRDALMERILRAIRSGDKGVEPSRGLRGSGSSYRRGRAVQFVCNCC